MDLSKLNEQFEEKDIEWRIMQSGKGAKGPWGKVAAYVTARAVMARFDAVCGQAHWSVQYVPVPSSGKDGEDGMLCGISVEVEPGVWVTKWDGSQNTDTEPFKGGISGALKRAAVTWGVGRYLYDLGEQWADIREDGEYTAQSKDKAGEKFSFKWNAPPLPKEFLPPGATVRRRSAPKTQEPSEPAEQPKPAKFRETAAAMAGISVDHLAELARLSTKEQITRYAESVKNNASIPEMVRNTLIQSARAKYAEVP